ncbi:hypothetical protein CUJ83_04910 [Methanocella sp. CWC-04]|uniref:Uncharacterized protein n=1 Tax=Methanooceanicella nereidis TaxID=2052831 RepID=A0AAP2RBL2_9EURY|nr:hypothetical protein [Methanocella sp. CWC-04]MCD1294338.1 hypothetical protein [Methanocella sp. CWC-04]
MIREVDEILLGYLREGLSEFISPENIVIEEFKTKKPKKSISLVSTEYVIEELGMGSSSTIKKEEAMEKFDTDGEKKDFQLSRTPLNPLISVESPPGTIKNEPDDYMVNYATGSISFRTAPEKAKDGVHARYNVARAVAETRNLKFVLNYSLIITTENPRDKSILTLEAIKLLYGKKTAMVSNGIEDFKLLKGYSVHASEGQVVDASVIDFQVVKIVEIEIPMPPMERIEIGEMKR